MQTAAATLTPTRDIRTPEQITRVFDFLAYQENIKPKADCIAYKENGQWRKYSTAQVRQYVNKVSHALLALGVQKGDMIGIISENRPEWNFVDIGITQLGAVVVPLYPNASAHDYEYILSHSEAKFVFVAGKVYYDKVRQCNLPQLREIYTFDKVDGAKSFADFLAIGEGKDDSLLEDYRNQVRPDDLMTLMYTSGTTGNPKGVMISHDNVVFNVLGLNRIKLLPDDVDDFRVLSFLPLCHVFEKVSFFAYVYRCASVYYAESMDTIAANLQEVKPHGFTTVPRLLEKVFEKIEAKGNELKGLKRGIFRWAMNLGMKYQPEKPLTGWYGFQLKLARKLVFSKWQEALGGNVRYILSGASALQPRLATIFWAAGIPVMEGYGQSESTPSGAVNSFGEGFFKVGTVGRVSPGIEVRIEPLEGYRSGEGEILIRGRNVMKGYFKQPDTTAETISEDGWLHTGDIGLFVDKSNNIIPVKGDQSLRHEDPYFLKITDRKKEVFKTSGGKYIAPLQIESKFKESSLIEQMCVVGEYQKFPAALIVPSFENLKTWCAEHEIKYTTNVDMVGHPAVLKKYQEVLDEYNKPFANYERIKKFALLPKEWTVESGELTPTMKMKRRVITANYKDIIEGFYKGE